MISACFVASKQSGGIRPNAIKAEPTVYTVNIYGILGISRRYNRVLCSKKSYISSLVTPI